MPTLLDLKEDIIALLVAAIQRLSKDEQEALLALCLTLAGDNEHADPT